MATLVRVLRCVCVSVCVCVGCFVFLLIAWCPARVALFTRTQCVVATPDARVYALRLNTVFIIMTSNQTTMGR